MIKVLITGAGSYIGTAVENWLKSTGSYEISVVDMIATAPEAIDFTDVDVVFHVAGIAHIKETKENAPLYYKVNRDLAIETARQAKKNGVKQFIILSSMSVYGKLSGVIKKDTLPSPNNHYGKSKYQADKVIEKMNDKDFRICILRPPMVYGKGCKGNYQLLRKLAMKSPVFPNLKNQRSMIHIDNLCGFVEKLIQSESSGLFFPQNKEYVCTSDMVRCIAKEHKHKVFFTSIGNFVLKHVQISVFKKVFGNLIYDCEEDRCSEVKTLDETIRKTER